MSVGSSVVEVTSQAAGARTFELMEVSVRALFGDAPARFHVRHEARQKRSVATARAIRGLVVRIFIDHHRRASRSGDRRFR